MQRRQAILQRYVVLAACACALAACGITDDRPQTLAYITETILAPNCASAECHSSMKRAYGFAFDTVANAQASFASKPTLIPPCKDEPPCADADTASYLLKILTSDQDVYGNRMPLDAPLANKDIFLIATWIEYGAAGYTQPAPSP